MPISVPSPSVFLYGGFCNGTGLNWGIVGLSSHSLTVSLKITKQTSSLIVIGEFEKKKGKKTVEEVGRDWSAL